MLESGQNQRYCHTSLPSKYATGLDAQDAEHCLFRKVFGPATKGASLYKDHRATLRKACDRPPGSKVLAFRRNVWLKSISLLPVTSTLLSVTRLQQLIHGLHTPE